MLILVPVLIGLTALTLLLMVGFGDGTRSRTQTRTAADAAALAAAQEWSHEVERLYQQVVEQRPGWPETLLTLLSPDAPLTIAGQVRPQAQSGAQSFAARNGSTLTGFAQSVTTTGIQWQVSTRSVDAAKVSDVHANATAVAGVTLLDGLCYLSGGTRLGLVVDDACLDPWAGNPPATVPTSLPPTIPQPFRPAALQIRAELVQ